MMSDIILHSLGLDRFSWGNKNLIESTPVRKRYIEALRAADNLNYKLLLEFVRE